MWFSPKIRWSFAIARMFCIVDVTWLSWRRQASSRAQSPKRGRETERHSEYLPSVSAAATLAPPRWISVLWSSLSLPQPPFSSLQVSALFHSFLTIVFSSKWHVKLLLLQGPDFHSFGQKVFRQPNCWQLFTVLSAKWTLTANLCLLLSLLRLRFKNRKVVNPALTL